MKEKEDQEIGGTEETAAPPAFLTFLNARLPFHHWTLHRAEKPPPSTTGSTSAFFSASCNGRQSNHGSMALNRTLAPPTFLTFLNTYLPYRRHNIERSNQQNCHVSSGKHGNEEQTKLVSWAYVWPNGPFR
jgi:hypothetical protein